MSKNERILPKNVKENVSFGSTRHVIVEVEG